MEKVSVRNLVEFILREGDIEPSGTAVPDPKAMQQGAKIHKRIQKERGIYYMPEVLLSVERAISYEDEYGGGSYVLKIEGRADGIEERPEDMESDKGEGMITIHEIKSMYADVSRFEEAKDIHLAQAKCYAAMYLENNKGKTDDNESDLNEKTDTSYDNNLINIEITYCQIETMVRKDFSKTYDRDEIMTWFEDLVDEYAKWITWKLIWTKNRNASIKGLGFPYEYRKGQFDLVKGVYVSILHDKNLFLQAPTGVGKTISTIYPAVTAMGEELSDKIFYLTAKTITRAVAEDTLELLSENGLKVKTTTITAKDKICIFDKADCDPARCPRARGHYDRINNAVFDMICNEDEFTRETVCRYAEKHNVCPFEMSLDAAIWSDVIICDYNYVFDPRVSLRRFFDDDGKKDYIFLIDEAHNLVDRARKMYSASLNKTLVMTVRRSVKNHNAALYKALDRINAIMLEYKRTCDECVVIESVGNLIFAIMRAEMHLEDFIKYDLPKIRDLANKDELLELYFSMRFFMEIHRELDEKYRIYADYNEDGQFRITLCCMDPSGNLRETFKRIRSAVFFSATLIPVRYYMEQLGAEQDDYTIYAETSFKNEQRLVLAATDVSARYARRTKDEFIRIAGYVRELVSAKKGNYIVYFPSYKMLGDVMEYIIPDRCRTDDEGYIISDGDTEYIIQKKNMSEAEKEEFLGEFSDAHADEGITKIGLCVMGGIFAEGIDLREDSLIGTVIVGTGLPMVGYERELFRDYFDAANGNGFEYAYLYPGMNKVLQAGGRVIRTASDRGVILLLDDRYSLRQYNSLFPREWSHYKYVNINNMKEFLIEFWEESRS